MTSLLSVFLDIVDVNTVYLIAQNKTGIWNTLVFFPLVCHTESTWNPTGFTGRYIYIHTSVYHHSFHQTTKHHHIWLVSRHCNYCFFFLSLPCILYFQQRRWYLIPLWGKAILLLRTINTSSVSQSLALNLLSVQISSVKHSPVPLSFLVS